MKNSIKKISLFITNIAFPLTVLSSIWLLIVRKLGIGKVNEAIFMKLGIFPVLDHYYAPLINPKKHLKKSLREDRKLPGVDLNDDEQLDLLAHFNYSQELLAIPYSKQGENEYYYDNHSYAFADGEYLYNIIRHYKPRKIIEIGCGFSTLMAQNAIKKNTQEDAGYTCNHICIEPYEAPWLEKLDVHVIRTKVEDVEEKLFLELEKNDILFIDSSHIIRPQGDVLFEYLEVLPILKSGVLVHVHDIFTPKDYLDDWILKEHLMWNEQYLLEAFLSFNSEFRIIGALNYLAHNHTDQFNSKCPVFAKEKNKEPGAFWMMKN